MWTEDTLVFLNKGSFTTKPSSSLTYWYVWYRCAKAFAYQAIKQAFTCATVLLTWTLSSKLKFENVLILEKLLIIFEFIKNWSPRPPPPFATISLISTNEYKTHPWKMNIWYSLVYFGPCSSGAQYEVELFSLLTHDFFGSTFFFVFSSACASAWSKRRILQ